MHDACGIDVHTPDDQSFSGHVRTICPVDFCVEPPTEQLPQSSVQATHLLMVLEPSGVNPNGQAATQVAFGRRNSPITHSSQVDPPVQREHPDMQFSHVRPVIPAPLPYVPVGHDVGHDVESILRCLELPQVWHVEVSAHIAQSVRHATHVRPVTDAPCSNVPAGHVDLHVARSTARNLLFPQESQEMADVHSTQFALHGLHTPPSSYNLGEEGERETSYISTAVCVWIYGLVVSPINGKNKH